MNEQKNNLAIPVSIVLAGFLIATGIYLSNPNKDAVVVNNDTTTGSDIDIKPVSSTEHILGNPDAAVVLVEFSDTECPFCKRFHNTLQTAISTYGKDGKFAWVYRHFPLDSLHSKARKEAEATECVNELGGNNAFWKMTDAIYTNTPGNNGLDAAKLPEFAKEAGVDVAKFNECLSSGRYASTVEAYFQDGVKAGAQGTPYSVLILKNKLSDSVANTIQTYAVNNRMGENIIISGNKKQIVFSGALPIEALKTVIKAVTK